MRLGEMCRSFVVIMLVFKSLSVKSTQPLFPTVNKSCLANYMIALKIYYTLSECIVLFLLQNAIQITLACLSQEVIQNFLSNIHLLTLHCWINIFSWPILFKLRTNQPFMKWISVSLNKASHCNRNNRKIAK